MKSKIVISLAALLLTTAAHSAWAKDADTGFVVTPTIAVSEEFDDNIYTESANTNSDFITRITPNINVKRKNEQNKFVFDAGAEQLLYADNADDNYLNYQAKATDRYTFDPSLWWEGSAAYRQRHSRRGDDQDNPLADATEPVSYSVFDAATSLGKSFDRVTLTPRLGYSEYDYDDVRRLNGAIQDEDFRDRDEYVMGGRIGYDVRGDKILTAFADFEANPRDYDTNVVTRRDSDGNTYMAGVEFNPNKDTEFVLSAGHMDREYDIAAYQDIDAIDVSALWAWTYEEDGEVSLSLDRYIAEVTDVNVGGAVKTDVKAFVTKALCPKLVGRLEGRYINSDYQGGNGASNGVSDREDDRFLGTVGLIYELRKKISLTAEYTYDNRDSNLNTADYEENVTMVGIKVSF